MNLQASPRRSRRRGASLIEVVSIVGITMLVLSTTSMAVIRVSQLNYRFKSIGMQQRGRHRVFEALREGAHRANAADVLDARRVVLTSDMEAETIWSLDDPPGPVDWQWEHPVRWRKQDGMLQVIRDPKRGGSEVVFEAAIGLTAPARLGLAAAPDAALLPPREELP